MLAFLPGASSGSCKLRRAAQPDSNGLIMGACRDRMMVSRGVPSYMSLHDIDAAYQCASHTSNASTKAPLTRNGKQIQGVGVAHKPAAQVQSCCSPPQ